MVEIMFYSYGNDLIITIIIIIKIFKSLDFSYYLNIMNFLKKKLKPLTSGSITTANLNQFGTGPGGQTKKGQTSGTHNNNRDLEDDLYDEYVIEAPPHPSELLALGVDPNEIDTGNPDKLRELYKKAIEEGKDKKTNSIFLARQRQKEELEEKKRTREEWKFFDSLASRVEEVVKTSQKNLDHWKESSTISQLTEPEYELRETADQVFKSVTTIKQEKGENDWIDFDEEGSEKVDLKAAARPRPRPRSQSATSDEPKQQQQQKQQPLLDEVDPFDSSFVVGPSVISEELEKQEADLWLGEDSSSVKEDSKKSTAAATYVDPFDTSYVNL